MIISKQTTVDMLKQLYLLSNDKQVEKCIDLETSDRLKNTFNKYKEIYFEQMEIGSKQIYPETRNQNQIQLTNDLYNQKYSSLFEQEDNQALRQIDIIHLNNVNKKQIHKNSSKFIQKNKENNKKSQQSLCSTYSKINLQSQNHLYEKVSQFKKKQNQKFITYKVQGDSKRTPIKDKNKNYKYEKYEKQKQITPSKVTPTRISHSKSTINLSKDKKIIRSNSQNISNRLFTTSINSTLKKDIHPNNRNSEVKLINTQKNMKKSQPKQSILKKSKQKLGKTINKQFSLESTSRNPLKSLIVINDKKNKLKNQQKSFKTSKDEYEVNNPLEKQSFQQKQIYQFSYKNSDQEDQLFEQIQILQKKQKRGLKTQPIQIYQQRQLSLYNDRKAQHFQYQQSQNQKNTKNFLKQIIQNIDFQKKSVLSEKNDLQQEVTNLRHLLSREKKILNQTLLKNDKLQTSIQNVKSLQNLLIERKQQTKSWIKQIMFQISKLQKSVKEKKKILTKISQQETKQEQQLIQMYENVIQQLKKQIKQQHKKKCDTKLKLQHNKKMIQSREVIFKSNYSTNKKVKNQLTDAFKQWV